MHGSTFSLLCILAVIQIVATHYDHAEYKSSATTPADLTSREDDDDDGDFDPSDLSSLVNIAAIGGSYSAGIGAGDRLGSVLGALDPQSGMLAEHTFYIM
jgi:hypothetical protein